MPKKKKKKASIAEKITPKRKKLDKKQKLFLWLPRGLAIALILFLWLFALDVFSEGYSFGQLLLALLMHSVPNLILLVALLIAWHKRLTGSIIFAILGLISIWFFKTYENIFVFLIISGLPLVIGGLFFLSWRLEKKE